MVIAKIPRCLGIILILQIIVFFCPHAFGKIICVDNDATGANDGTNWNKAYSHLQDALTNADPGDEIHVAKGMYKPDQETVTGRNAMSVTSGDRTASFQLKNGVSIRGGYAGNGESDPDARDIHQYKTILSGDLSGNDGPNFTNYSENSHHVVTGNGTDATAVLDGFTVTGGNATDTAGGYGGGMLNSLCTPTVTNCIFTKNLATRGGGIANRGDVGILSGPTVINCSFYGNLAQWGGGMCFWGFVSGTLTNCIFSGNAAEDSGAIVITKNSEVTIWNCTFTGNRASDGTAGGINCTGDCSVTLFNSILWGDSPNEIDLLDSSITVTYSNVQGGWPGAGNVNAHPLFVDIDGADDAIGTEDDDLRLLPDSPCIDAGDNTVIPQLVITDLDGNPRIVNQTVDMGAYEADIAPKPNIHYVDVDAPGNNDGSSWSNAFLCLQDALAITQKSDEIRVANGEYKPDQCAILRRDQWQIVSSSDWTATFQLIDGVTIKGGYAGFDELDPDARDIERYKSVLSGDLNGDDGLGFTNIEDNSYQVVTTSGTKTSAVLDGFTVTGGNADGPFPYDHGGGIYNVEGSPTLIDCTITANTTTGYGGGMFNDVSSPIFLNCIFTGNSAYEGHGGGMYNYGSNPMLANCEFVENSSVGGGGMYNKESEPMLSDCTFSGNSSTGSGGGMFNEDGNPVLLGCTFSENSAPRRSGGGMHNRSNSQPTLANCLFIGNSAINGGAMDNIHTSSPMLLNCTICANVATEAEGGGISIWADARPILVNCIVWNNSDVDGIAATSQISGFAEVSYSCVRDSTSINPWSGLGNINEDPFFADPENGDYHLKSQAGRWNSASQSWVIDQISSPCIDAGDPSDSVGLERLPNGERINMGAYGGTPEASLSPWQPEPLLGQAMNPFPENSAVDVDINIILSWTPGSNAVLHDVYFGTNREDVANAERTDTTGIYRGRNSNVNYTPPEGLINSETYYWRIDEVNDRYEESPYKGEVWSFSIESETLEAGLVAYYPMNEGRGTIIGDASGNDHDGQAQAVPEWVDGPIGYGRALYFDGSDPARAWVNCGTWNPSAGTGRLTVALWIRWDGPAANAWQMPIAKRDYWNEQDTEEMWLLAIDQDSHTIHFHAAGNWPYCGNRVLPIGQWSHVAVTFDGTIMIFYIDGQETGRGEFSFGPKTDSSLNIGAADLGGWNAFHGVLDEIRLYNIALSPEEIIGLAAHYGAFNPEPANGANYTESWVTLSWSPGISVVSHDVYFGDDRDSVDTGTGGTFMANQTATWFNIGSVQSSYLVPGTTYFWRIDEVCTDGTIYKGNIWSFSTGSSTGPPKGRTCFTPETNIWMNDALIPISKVNSGQKLCGMNKINKIQKVQEHNGTYECYDIFLESGNCLSVAENHYFLAECGRWISLKKLNSGIKLQTLKGAIEITKITKRPKPYTGKVYNLKIDGSDRYIVGEDAIVVRDY